MITFITSNNIYKIIYSLFFIVTLSSCDDAAWDRPVRPVTISVSNEGCTCPGQHYKLVNSSHKEVKVAYKEVNIYGAQNKSILKTKFIPAMSSRPLGCEIVTWPTSTVGHTCNTQVNWEIIRVNDITSLKLSHFRLASLKGMNSSDNSELSKIMAPKTCWIDCSDPFSDQSTGSCVVVDQPIGINQQLQGVRWLADEIQNKTGIRLKATSIMKKFDVQSDPCDRTDTFIETDKITNSGRGCLLSGEVEIAGPPATPFEIHMPEVINGLLNRSNTGFELTFPEKETALTLNFCNNGICSDFDADYGGLVHHIKETDNHLVFTTTRGCVGFNFN